MGDNIKYLFFDIECANGYLECSKICSFGYVLTDNNLNIITEEDIFINPIGKFNLTGRKYRTDIKLKYPEEHFRKYKKFHHYYPKIKSLLEDKETIVIGYSTDNDVRYILTELLFFYEEPINFKYYDVQEIFDNEFDFEKKVSLSNASELLGLNKQDDEHDSLSDAKSTMEIFKKICEELKLTKEELLNKFEPHIFKDYKLSADKDEKILELTSFKLTKYYIKQEKEPIDFVYNKRICFSDQLTKEELKRTVNLYKVIVDGGAIYDKNVLICDYYVCDDTMDEEDSKYKFAQKNNIKIIKYSDFLNELNINNDILDNMNPLDNLVKKYEESNWVLKQISKIKNSKPLNTSIGDLFSDVLNDFKK